MQTGTVNVIVAGLGGQGVLKASDILADAAFRTGLDVKKGEVHGMAQRGGSVISDVRFGPRVFSPLVPRGEADVVLLLANEQLDHARSFLKPGGLFLEPSLIDAGQLPHARSLNIAMLGLLSRHLELPEANWQAALEANLPAASLETNRIAFALGRNNASSESDAGPLS